MITVIACGILEPEIRFIFGELVVPSTLRFLPAELHVHTSLLRNQLIEELKRSDPPVIVIYGKCFPGIEDVCRTHGVHRIQIDTCYEMVAGTMFHELLKEEPGTYFLLPQFCCLFERLTKALDIGTMKEFLLKNYSRCVLLDTGMETGPPCEPVAEILGLHYERVDMGIEMLKEHIKNFLIDLHLLKY